jgi:Fe-S-cluster containining protein
MTKNYKTIIVKKARFECQQCGRCCTSPVSLFLSSKDIEEIKKLGYDSFFEIINVLYRDKFTGKAVEVPRTIMRAREFGYCFFHDPVTKLCDIYNSRPEICRLFPFTRLSIDEKNIIYSRPHELCRGIGKGDLVDTLYIKSIIKECMKRDYVLWGDILKINNSEELKDS